jgi:DNA-binding response OmpR family regulator
MPKLKFLVVEDDLFYQTYMNDLLAETDVDIVNASDGEAGLAMAIAELPDLIITDIEIPKIQGFVLFKALREHPDTKDIPVIMMSGKVEKALLDRHSRLSMHAEGYLVKPFSGQVLIDMIRDVVGKDFGFSEVVIPADGESVSDPSEPALANGTPEISQFPEEDHEVLEGAEELTVLVVDDSRYICDITSDFMEELGIRTETAFDGEAGFKLASDLIPDLVLLDVQMPNLNGFVVCEMLRKQEETKNIPIILMSAVVDDESFQRHSKLRYHADAYLQKPFMKSELHQLVRRFTRLGQSASDEVERKTGFFVPLEEVDGYGEPAGQASGTVDPKLLEELKKTRSDLEGKIVRESQLLVEVGVIKKEKDQLEAELFELRKTVEGMESGLQDKLTLVTQRFEEARTESERLAEENRGLQVRLEEASSGEKRTEELEELARKLKDTQKELSDRVSENKTLTEKLKEAESSAELKAQLKELGTKLEVASALALDMEDRNKQLEKEIQSLREKEILDAGSGDDAGDSVELQKEIEALRRDLTAATAAKMEIEDQAKSLLENRGAADETPALKEELERIKKENQELLSRISDTEGKVKWLEEVQSQLEKVRSDYEELQKKFDTAPEDTNAELTTLKDKLSAALKKAESLEKERDNLLRVQEELEEARSRNMEMEKLTQELKKEGEECRKLAASETAARMDLEGREESQAEEREMLIEELEEAKRQLKESAEAADRIADLEIRLENERELRVSADKEVLFLKAELQKTTPEDEKLQELEKNNQELKAALGEARQRREQLERKAGEASARQVEENFYGDSDASHLNERLDQLEETLGKTVREAQTILMEQKERESSLEESLESLMRSLEEERSSYREDRESWSSRERELKDAFEDALRESRRLIGEEAARLYPIHIPRGNRPLEVMTSTSKYRIAATAAIAALVLFGIGYLARSKIGTTTDKAVIPVQSMRPAPEPQISAGKPPEPWIARSGPEVTYEELWRRNTVQSVSDDMMIQATLHTKEELETAIKYTAAKEGWTRERTVMAMADMAKTYNLSGSYYITVYSKNLKSGYPGYVENFERHIALRDQSGREVRAHLPGELEESRFITSRVSAAGKEMNPVFLYEVGLTVAFSRKELAGKPEGLQLVLYDIGAVPIRVLTWDMSRMGSLSYNETDREPGSAS